MMFRIPCFLYTPLIALICLIGCADNQQEYLNRVKKLEADFHALEATHEYILTDTLLNGPLVRAYLNYARLYPEDTNTPRFLFRAADLCVRGRNEVLKGIRIYQQLFTEYPEHPASPTAMFLCGYLYAYTLRDPVHAREYYQRVIDTYPGTTLATTAHFEIETSGMSDVQTQEYLLNRIGQDTTNK